MTAVDEPVDTVDNHTVDKQPPRAVLVREEQQKNARTMYSLFVVRGNGLDAVERLLGLKEGIFYKVCRGVNCTGCGAPPDVPCRTKTGNLASRPHRTRQIALIAVILAMHDEPVITEEPDLIEQLTG